MKYLNDILINWNNSNFNDNHGLLPQNSFYNLNDHIEEVQEYLKNNIIDVYTKIYDYIYFCASHILENPGNTLSAWNKPLDRDFSMYKKSDAILINFYLHDIRFEPCSIARGMYIEKFRKLRCDIENIINNTLKKVDGLGILLKKYKFYYGDFFNYMISFLDKNIGISIYFERSDNDVINPNYTIEKPLIFKGIDTIYINRNDFFWRKSNNWVVDLHELGRMMAVDKRNPQNIIYFDLPFNIDLCMKGFKKSEYWGEGTEENIILTYMS